MVTSEVEQLRAENALLRAQLSVQAVIPELPVEYDGEAIAWRSWEVAPVISCYQAVDFNTCAQCSHPGPSVLAFGLAGPGKPLLRFQAHRCPACQETTVYRRDRDWRGLDLVQIAYHPPRTIAAHT